MKNTFPLLYTLLVLTKFSWGKSVKNKHDLFYSYPVFFKMLFEWKEGMAETEIFLMRKCSNVSEKKQSYVQDFGPPFFKSWTKFSFKSKFLHNTNDSKRIKQMNNKLVTLCITVKEFC